MGAPEILFALLRYKNGIVADNMRNCGIIYARNYGVSIVDIKRISAAYFPNHNLACELFERVERECKIAATFIESPDAITLQQICEWSKSFTNVEIVEQTCMNLFYKTKFANQLVEDWIVSNNAFLRQAAWNILSKNSDGDKTFLLNIISKLSEYNYDLPNVHNAAIQALVRVSRNENILENLKNEILKMIKSADSNVRFVGSETFAYIKK